MNDITISGTVVSEPEFSHETHGKKLYEFFLSSQRMSGTCDTVPCLISEEMKDRITDGAEVKLIGEVRTNNRIEEKMHLEIRVFVIDVLPVTGADENIVNLHGYLCRDPKYRLTPSDIQICDLLIASQRGYGRSDYIPSIAWGANALKAKNIMIGTKVNVVGRLQSRIYQKQLPSGLIEMRTAYELSIFKIERA